MGDLSTECYEEKQSRFLLSSLQNLLLLLLCTDGVSMMLCGERSQLYLSPNLKGNTVYILPLNIMLSIVFGLNISYKYLRYVKCSLVRNSDSPMTQPHQADPYKLRDVRCFKLLNMGVIC